VADALTETSHRHFRLLHRSKPLMKIGFLGLGNMGQAIAGNLLKGGHELRV
jgi:lactate dehydrogenase-like 2-hydroxyacid dehydrogenase